MKTCRRCGKPIEFRTVDGQPVPLHLYGSCIGAGGEKATDHSGYVNPNAYCPVCGATVFFYQSPLGGRVFFDALGPPWPKHPCTDNSSIPRFVPGKPHQPKQNIEGPHYTWETEGWSPFFISVVAEVDRFTLRINGEYNGKDTTIYVRKIDNLRGSDNPISKDCIAHLKEAGDGSFKLSFIAIYGTDHTISAFSLISKARMDRTTTITVPRRAAPETQREPRNGPCASANKSKQNQNLQSQKTMHQSVIALAFTTAKKKQDK